MEMFIDQKPDKKQTFTGLIVVLVLLFVLGLLLTLTSATIGLSTANAELAKNGGSMDTGPLVAALPDTGAACVCAAFWKNTARSRMAPSPPTFPNSAAPIRQPSRSASPLSTGVCIPSAMPACR